MKFMGSCVRLDTNEHNGSSSVDPLFHASQTLQHAQTHSSTHNDSHTHIFSVQPHFQRLGNKLENLDQMIKMASSTCMKKVAGSRKKNVGYGVRKRGEDQWEWLDRAATAWGGQETHALRTVVFGKVMEWMEGGRLLDVMRGLCCA